MKKNLQRNPKLVSVTYKNGALLPDCQAAMQMNNKTVREDLQAVRRRPLDAPMATRLEIPDPMSSMAWENKSSYRLDDVTPKLGIGRLAATLFLMTASFIAGVVVGRMA